VRRGVVVGGLVLAVVLAVRVVTGGDSGATAAPGASTPATASPSATAAPDETDGEASDGEASGTSEAVAAASSVAESTDDTPPSAVDPARVLIVGDSDAGTFGPYLSELLDETGIVETTLDYKVSSGLARPDFFDWPAELDRIVPEVDPDIVVVTFGGNDAQFLADLAGDVVAPEPRPDSDNAEWRAEYERRVGAVMDRLLEGGRTVIWVGIPNDDNPDVTFRMQVQDESAKAAAATRPAVQFVDTWTRFAGRNGGFAEFVVDPRDGVGKDVRADDGFHLNTVGAEILALDIAQVVNDDLARRIAAG
jgi:uncharacterized protein